jgi:uncharacterized membrane protein YkvA (DUF1232 family)
LGGRIKLLGQIIESWKERIQQLKIDTYALYLAYKDPRVPVYARILAAGVVAYAFSPIDLIPDFIPILGYLDDLLIIPLGIWVSLKLIPSYILAEHRQRAEEIMRQGLPVSRAGAAIVIAIWVLLTALVGLLAYHLVKK